MESDVDERVVNERDVDERDADESDVNERDADESDVLWYIVILCWFGGH